MGLGRKQTGWSMHCSPDTPPARREDEQISEGQTQEIAFSFLWDEKLPHGQALSPCGSTDFTSPSAPARHQAQSPSPCPPPAVRVRRSWKSWKIWIWFQLTSVSFPFCPEGIATANVASFSSTCAKRKPNQNQTSTLKMQE